MFDALIFVLDAGLAQAGTPETRPAPVAIWDLLIDEPGAGRRPSGESPGNERCRLYNCGMPRLDLEGLLARPHKERQEK